MLHAIIRGKKGIVGDIDLSMSSSDLFHSLDGTGIINPGSITIKSEQLPCAALYASNKLGECLLKILKPNETLEDVCFLENVVTNVRNDIKAELEQRIIDGRYKTKEELYQGIIDLKLSIAPKRLTFYCTLHAEYDDGSDIYRDELIPVDNSVLLANREIIERELIYDQNPSVDIAERISADIGMEDKIVYAVWNVDEKGGVLYARLNLYLKEPATDDEIEKMRNMIAEKYNYGFGYKGDQFSILTEEDEIFILYGLYDSGSFIYTESEMEKYLNQKALEMNEI